MLKDNFVVLGLLLAGLAAMYVLIWRRRQFSRRAVRTTGTVVALYSEERVYASGPGQDHTSYYAHVNFSLDDGSPISFRNGGSFVNEYKVGDSVPVAYDRQAPSATAVVDREAGKGDFPAVTLALQTTALFAAAVAWVLFGPSC